MWTMAVLNGVQKLRVSHSAKKVKGQGEANHLWGTGSSSSLRAQHTVVKLNLEQSIWCLGMDITCQGILGMRLQAGPC